MDQEYKYFAFISYNSKDTEWGKRVQRKLEHYRMPSTLCSQHGWERIPIKPVFFAPTDIQPGGLSEELQQRLQASRNLIVICSPNSARSEWVGREIEYFHNLGRTQNIHFFIVDGTPHSGDPETECFNPVVDKLGLPEILGANIHEKIYRSARMNRERAYVQLVSKLLGVEFDAIWQRHRRLMRRRRAAWAIGAVAVVAALVAVWVLNKPVNVAVQCHEQPPINANLPEAKDIVVTLTLENETKTDTLASFDTEALFANIPHRFVGKQVQITAQCHDFEVLDTTLALQSNMKLELRRSVDVYGKVHFKLWNTDEECTYPNTKVEVEGLTATSDSDGNVDLLIPLEQQRQSYRVSVPALKMRDAQIGMPCGEDDILIVNE